MQNFNFIEKLVSGVNRETGKNYKFSDIVLVLCTGVMFLFCALLLVAGIVFVCITE